MEKWIRLENESDEELIYRICSAKEEIGTWDDVADILNNILGTEYTSSKFRKQYQAFVKMLEANESKFFDDDGYLKELQLERQELRKEKQKLSDERVELARIIREEARKESYLDLVRRVLLEESKPIELFETNNCNYVHNENSLIVHLTDIHAGEEVNVYNNTFNQDVLKRRFEDYTNKIIEIAELHKSEDCYIIASEIISGCIHNNLRLQNNMDMIESFKYVCDLISAMLISIHGYFNNIHVYVTEGNHSRITPNKEDSLKGENMDLLLNYYLKARLQNYDNIYCHENDIGAVADDLVYEAVFAGSVRHISEHVAVSDDRIVEVAKFNVYDNVIMSAHGDRDTPQNVVQNFTMIFGVKPDIVYLGHRHTNGLSTVFGSRVIESGSFIGTNNYAQDIRKVSKPEQTISVVDKNGLVCLYDVTL